MSMGCDYYDVAAKPWDGRRPASCVETYLGENRRLTSKPLILLGTVTAGGAADARVESAMENNTMVQRSHHHLSNLHTKIQMQKHQSCHVEHLDLDHCLVTSEEDLTLSNH